jgi:hypothetical protein
VLRPSDAIALVRAVLTDHPEPTGELVIGLDADRRLTGLGIRPTPVDHPAVDRGQLVALARELDARALVLVSLLADERELMAEADVDGFLALGRACLTDGVLLLDHVLVAGSTWWSLWDAVVGEGVVGEGVAGEGVAGEGVAGEGVVGDGDLSEGRGA